MEVHLPHLDFSIRLWGQYFFICLIATVGLRVLFAVFRAWAVMRGDPDSQNTNNNLRFGQAWLETFKGFSQSKAHADFWLNAIIGFFELAAYPILLKTDNYTIIGGWIVIRTAGNWGGWTVSRTSFNRYLFNIILVLLIACFLCRYVQVSPASVGWHGPIGP